MPLTPTVRYALIGIIVLILAGFAGWYLFIQAKQSAIESGDSGRGAGVAAPTFAGRAGSTYENIVSTLSATLTGDRETTTETRDAQLMQVSRTPTAGAGFMGSATSTRIRFVERGTGYVFDFALDTQELERLTNTLVPRTYEAFVATNGVMIVKNEEENGNVVTAKAHIGTTTDSGEVLYPLIRNFIAGNISAAAPNPTGTEAFYIVQSDNGWRGMRVPWGTGAGREVISTMISGWNIHWLSNDRIVLSQKPSDGATGYAYEVRGDGRLVPLAQAPGLTFLPHPSSRAMLYGASTDTGLSLFVRGEGATSTEMLLPLKTIADKCVWHPRNPVAYCATPQTQPSPGFIERWLRGESRTLDSWWQVNALNGTVELLDVQGGATIDVERPVIDSSGTFITFINANDKSLWRLRIADE